MARRSASTALLVALFVLPLYPKISLVSVGGTYIPVRIDDLVVAALAVIWVVALMTRRRLPAAPRALSLMVLLWLGVSLIALLVGAFVLESIGFLTGLAFWAKPIEYVLLGLITYDLVASRWVSIRSVVITILASAAIVVAYGLPEHFGLVPHLPGSQPLPGGTTSTMGDWHELASYLGLIIILAVCIFHDVTERWQRFGLVALAGAAIFVQFTSGTRSEYIALFLVLFGLLFWRPARVTAGLSMVAMVGFFVSPIVGFVLFPPPGLQQAVSSGDPKDIDLNSLGPFYNVTIRFVGYPLAMSLAARFEDKWPHLLAAAMHSPIIGLGPSAATEAADGYYLRSFVESGIVGLAVFIGLVITLFRSTIDAVRGATGPIKSLAVASLAMTVFVTLVGVLIDTWVGSRVMELYWPLIGVALGAVAAQTAPRESAIEISGRQPVSAASSA